MSPSATSPLPKLSDVEQLRCNRAYAIIRDTTGGVSTQSVAHMLRITPDLARAALKRLALEGSIIETTTRHKINLWRVVPHVARS